MNVCGGARRTRGGATETEESISAANTPWSPEISFVEATNSTSRVSGCEWGAVSSLCTRGTMNEVKTTSVVLSNMHCAAWPSEYSARLAACTG